MEANETLIGREHGKPVKRACRHKMKVLSLVDRATGRVRCIGVDDAKRGILEKIVGENASREARVMTD